MGSPLNSISPQDLYQRIGTAAAPLVIDLRRRQRIDADDRAATWAEAAPALLLASSVVESLS
jgi:hypothetical protein